MLDDWKKQASAQNLPASGNKSGPQPEPESLQEDIVKKAVDLFGEEIIKVSDESEPKV
ncbi:hypothetical protein D3C83_90810 [compost metagenome]